MNGMSNEWSMKLIIIFNNIESIKIYVGYKFDNFLLLKIF